MEGDEADAKRLRRHVGLPQSAFRHPVVRAPRRSRKRDFDGWSAPPGRLDVAIVGGETSGQTVPGPFDPRPARGEKALRIRSGRQEAILFLWTASLAVGPGAP